MSGIKIGIGFGGGRLGLPSPDTLCAYAERAEDLGIDSIWLSDRITASYPHLDIGCVMALFAARTTRIKMGPSVLTLPARNPVEVARTYATLDYLTGGCGRVIMAVGLGTDPRDCLACGIPAEQRGARMEEGVAVLRKLWAEPHVTHHGRFYQFDDVPSSRGRHVVPSMSGSAAAPTSRCVASPATATAGSRRSSRRTSFAPVCSAWSPTAQSAVAPSTHARPAPCSSPT